MSKANKDIFYEDGYYDEEIEDTQKGKVLTFRLAGKEYGIKIFYPIEIVGMKKIMYLPNMPDNLKGIIDHRGKIIPVLDVGMRFKIRVREYHNRTRILVININNSAVGLVVDLEMNDDDTPLSEIKPPTIIQKKTGDAFLKGMVKIGKDIKILLGVNKLFYEKEP